MCAECSPGATGDLGLPGSFGVTTLASRTADRGRERSAHRWHSFFSPALGQTMPYFAHRAVDGLSMGADGAMQLAMNFAPEFSVAGAHSPTLRPYGQSPSFFGGQAYADAHEPAYLFRRMPASALGLVLEADIGTDDTMWRPSAEAFHQQLLAQGISHQWHDQWAGGHEGSYWSAHTGDYLRFYDAGFKGGAGPVG